MTPVRLNEILKNPHSVSEKEIETIHNIITDFPYFNLPYILLAKIYHQSDDYRFDSQLKKASLRSTNREKLYYYINEESVTDFNKSQTSQSEKEIQTEVLEVSGQEEKTIETKAESDVEIIEENTIEEAEVASSEQIEAEVVTEQIDELAELNLEIYREDEIDIFTESEQELEAEKIAETETQSEHLQEEDLYDNNKEEASTNSTYEGYNTFSDWLNRFSKTDISSHEVKRPENKPEQQITAEKDNSNSLSEIAEISQTFKELSKPKKVTKSLELIDSFLQKNPTISHPKTEFFKPEKAAMRSLDLNDGIVTETLAKLYAKQGHIEEAIWAYEKLKLKLPKKETYFATLINDLKKESE